MRKIITIIFIFSYTFLGGQNLVPNGSFENISSCGVQGTLAINWTNPTQGGSPDLFNSCFPNRVPSNGTYYQWPKTGNSFGGFYLYDRNTSDAREYLQSQLSSSLQSGFFYLITFYSVLSNISKYSNNNIGAYLSSNAIYTPGNWQQSFLNYSTQIKKYNNPVITDTLNWIEISAIYQAIGGEQYITLGNFNADSSTDTLKVCSNCLQNASYYFIDDISVTNITTPQWQYRDTTIYLGDSVLIGPAITGLNVDWFDMSSTFIKNDPGIYVKPTVTTSYQAIQTFNSAVYNHTVTVTVLLPTKINEYETLQNSIQISPNPGATTFNIATFGLADGEIEISVSDVTGKLVMKNTLNIVNALALFNLDAKNRIYFVKITSKDKTITKKLVVQQ